MRLYWWKECLRKILMISPKRWPLWWFGQVNNPLAHRQRMTLGCVEQRLKKGIGRNAIPFFMPVNSDLSRKFFIKQFCKIHRIVCCFPTTFFRSENDRLSVLPFRQRWFPWWRKMPFYIALRQQSIRKQGCDWKIPVLQFLLFVRKSHGYTIGRFPEENR